jgi:nucleotide-binding universal stress UspA family protein
MYLSLLVPLDRTPFAEQALPLALAIARQAHARLDLVKVHALYALKERSAGWAPFEPELDAECKDREQLYLEATAAWATSEYAASISTGVLPGSAVLPETVADKILERARTDKADLIVMTTHGRGLFRRAWTGSVTDQLIRRAGVPVLIVRPAATPPWMFQKRVVKNILIPLDGSTLAEQVLGPALDLAHLMEAQCSLLRVVQPPHPTLSPWGRGQGEGTLKEAVEYLEGVATWVREQGIPADARVISAPHVAEAILEEAAAHGNDLIAVATHGWGAFKRLMRGSVVDKLIRGTASPVLVYRPCGKR